MAPPNLSSTSSSSNILNPHESFHRLSMDEQTTKQLLETVEEEVSNPAVDDILIDVQREEWYKVFMFVLFF
jgi:hypothetical protein